MHGIILFASQTIFSVWFFEATQNALVQGVAVGFLVEAYILNNQAEKVHGGLGCLCCRPVCCRP